MKRNKENNYAFIDAQNLYLGTKDDGWAVDIFKLRVYLKDKNKFKVALSPNRKKTSFLLRKACGWEKTIKYLIDIKHFIKKDKGENKKRQPLD